MLRQHPGAGAIGTRRGKERDGECLRGRANGRVVKKEADMAVATWSDEDLSPQEREELTEAVRIANEEEGWGEMVEYGGGTRGVLFLKK